MAKYTLLEYIEATGTQHIDTGVIPTQATGFEIDFLSNNKIGASDYGCIMGCRQSSGKNEFQLTTYSNNLSVYSGTIAWGSTRKSAGLVVGERMTTSCHNLAYSNSLGYSCEIAKVEGAIAPSPLLVFELNQVNNTAGQHGKGRLYGLKLYDGDTLIRDYVPCKNEDGEIGLWDLVEDKFYGNAGTDTFIAGAEVVPVDPNSFYYYNGLKLPAPPDGFAGHMLLVNDAETSQYVMCYGSFYRYPFDPKPIVCPSASLPTCYAITAGETQWEEVPLIPDGGEEKWVSVCSPNEFIWTNQDIYWLDSETASNPTSEVACYGSTAVLAPEEPEEPEEPVPVTPIDAYSNSLVAGCLTGCLIRGWRGK